MRDDVVHVAGDAGALLLCRELGALVPLAAQCGVLLLQPGQDRPPAAHEIPGDPGHDGEAGQEGA